MIISTTTIISVANKQLPLVIEVIPEHPYYPFKVYLGDTSISLSEKEAEELGAKLNQALFDLDIQRKEKNE